MRLSPDFIRGVKPCQCLYRSSGKLSGAPLLTSPRLRSFYRQTQSSFMIPVFAQLIRTFLASDAELRTTVNPKWTVLNFLTFIFITHRYRYRWLLFFNVLYPIHSWFWGWNAISTPSILMRCCWNAKKCCHDRRCLPPRNTGKPSRMLETRCAVLHQLRNKAIIHWGFISTWSLVASKATLLHLRISLADSYRIPWRQNTV